MRFYFTGNENLIFTMSVMGKKDTEWGGERFDLSCDGEKKYERGNILRIFK